MAHRVVGVGVLVRGIEESTPAELWSGQVVGDGGADRAQRVGRRRRGFDGGLRSRDLLSFTTIDAAQSCGLDARTGSITPGKDADIILLRADDLTVFPVTDPAASIVSAGHPGLVDTVLVAGRVVKRDGVLTDVDLTALRTRLLESRTRIAAAAGIPLNGTWHPQPELE